MAFPIVNSIASWFLKKRIHQMELFLKYPNEVQHELLNHLVQKSKNTVLGEQYGFNEIKNYETFKERVPIITYEEFEPLIERSRQGENNLFWPTPIKWFAKSSGTTNAKSKFIPVSSESLEDCHYAGSKDLLCLYLNNNPNSKLFTGKSLRLGGSKELYKENGTSFGDLSAILIDNMPFWASYSSTPNNEISLMSDFEAKMFATVKSTIKENVTSLAGVPSWMLVLLNRVLSYKDETNLINIWPDLEVYFHGGVSFEPYMQQYQSIIPRDQFRYYEIYNASEGFFAVQDQNQSKELLLMLDYGIFYEFIPMETYGTANEKIFPLDGVEQNKNYAVVITTNAGLWRYKVGDTVRFTSLSPYRIKVTGRTKHHINVFGEELIIENAETALKRVCQELHCEIVDYTAGPVFMKGKDQGAHEWIIEFNKLPDSLANFKAKLDLELQRLNSDYEAKRKNNVTLNPLVLHAAKPKLFYVWSKQQNKLGGQHKIPRLSNKRDYIEELLRINDSL
ncbi:GH3 auxin-responsive promoter family protein [Mesonia sp. HuA40]|uniref:GH3 auxin-responsive promoter family protein n=1 Tax=Mesonia sp. HuA40 TaxID=2602761 RepID=UPI0011C85C8C|nr:GH3 auxin-responsive promoter family protein [Mesonia sp. HuA40]TXK73974.1 GH3 auxin-responsive promoter family protein [Mesonia sp. HuA40]